MVALRDEHDRRRIIRRRTHLRIVHPQPLPLVRRDTLPEHTDYRDTGCDLSRSCLRCPLARCKYDARGNSQPYIDLADVSGIAAAAIQAVRPG